MSPPLDPQRIQHLLNPEDLSDKLVTIVGLGSGGAPVCDHGTMNGIRWWHMYDRDSLSPENLVKHPRMRADLGKPKVVCQKEWVLDRNPDAEVVAFEEDVLASSNFRESVSQSSLVLSCTDSVAVREYINDVCVESRVPCVTAGVFRTGVGGEVYAYKPGETGCYRCLQIYAAKSNLNLPDSLIDMTGEEEENIYGLGIKDYQASGLSIDIQSIALIQARMALSILLEGVAKFPLLKSNWIIFGNRPQAGLFRSHFECQQVILRPQLECTCNDTTEM